jgi:acyl-CoA thioesterase-1
MTGGIEAMRMSCCVVVIVAALLAAPAAAQTRVVVVGDSNVAGTAVSSSERYPAQLERALRARGLDVQVANAGQNGDTTSGVLARLDSAVPAGTQVAVLWVGVNDRRRGASPEQIQAGRQRIASALQARGVRVYTIRPPLYGPELHQRAELVVGGGDAHFNGRGYALMVGRTVGPVAALVRQAPGRRAR